METVTLGGSGLQVSRICLGTMTFSREADTPTSFEIMDTYREHGGFYLDTANVYSAGQSEAVVGKWVRDRGCRDEVVLATKVYGEMGEGANDRGLSRIHIHREVENSLRRLQTDFIDLYQIHRMDAITPVEETVRALDDLIRDGKVRYVGSSNLKGFELMTYLSVADASLRNRMISHQPAYSPLNRAIEREVLPLCLRENIGLVTYNPLAGGALTGKYLSAMPPGSRMEQHQYYRDRYLTDESEEITREFVAAAGKRGVSPAQLALAWVLAEPGVTSAIVGARNRSQLEDTLAGANLELENRSEIPAVKPGMWVGKDPVYDRGS